MLGEKHGLSSLQNKTQRFFTPTAQEKILQFSFMMAQRKALNEFTTCISQVLLSIKTHKSTIENNYKNMLFSNW